MVRFNRTCALGLLSVVSLAALAADPAPRFTPMSVWNLPGTSSANRWVEKERSASLEPGAFSCAHGYNRGRIASKRYGTQRAGVRNVCTRVRRPLAIVEQSLFSALLQS